MFIINDTYFVREIAIPDTIGVDIAEDNNPFEYWIDSECRLCMKNALGQKNFREFEPLFDATTGAIDAGADDKWKELVNGKGYTYQGKEYFFEGLIQTNGTHKTSMLAQFTFSKWFKFKMSVVSGMGEQIGSAANSFLADGARREMSAWNEFLKAYQGDLTEIQTVHKQGLTRNRYVPQTNYVSLLEFLIHNEETYPDAGLKLYKYRNRFSI